MNFLKNLRNSSEKALCKINLVNKIYLLIKNYGENNHKLKIII